MGKEIDFPPVWLAAFALLGGLVRRLLPIATPLNMPVGGALIILGLAIMILAALQMMLARTTVIPRRDPQALVTGGLFRFSRNPIYLADAILLAGLYIAWDALAALPLVAVFVMLIQRRFILGEEARLARRFPEAFAAYVQRTRRWI